MKTTFKLANVHLNIAGVDIQVGELSTSVEDYNILEGLKVAKELPNIMRGLQEVFLEGLHARGHVDLDDEEELQEIVEEAYRNGYRLGKDHAHLSKQASGVEDAKQALANALDVEVDQITIGSTPDLLPAGIAEAYAPIGFVRA